MQIHEMSSMPVLLALMLLGYTGVLAMEILRRWRTRWEKCVHRIYLLGLGMTVLTEAFQYILRLGLAEMDDVIHNMAELLIGWAAYSAAQSAAEALTK